MNTTLIIMAAGIGSRFGTGIKRKRGRIYKGSFCDPQGD